MNDSQRPSPLPPAPPDRPAGLWERWSGWRILIWAAVLLIGDVFLQAAVYSLTNGLFGPVFCGSLLAVVLPCWLTARSAGGTLGSEFRLAAGRPALYLWCLLAAVGSLLPASLLGELSLRLHPISPEWLAFYLERLPTGPVGIAGAAVTVTVVAPLAEELLFRGILHRLARRLWGFWPAAVVSALCFALVHGEPWYLFGLIGLGLVLSLIFELSGSLTACVVTHGLYNAISFALLIGGGGEAAAGGAQPPSVSDVLLTGASLALLWMALWRLGRR